MAASAGAIAVFGLGVLGVMGAAKGAAWLLGALQQSLRRAFLRCCVLSAARRSLAGCEAQRRSPGGAGTGALVRRAAGSAASDDAALLRRRMRRCAPS